MNLEKHESIQCSLTAFGFSRNTEKKKNVMLSLCLAENFCECHHRVVVVVVPSSYLCKYKAVLNAYVQRSAFTAFKCIYIVQIHLWIRAGPTQRHSAARSIYYFSKHNIKVDTNTSCTFHCLVFVRSKPNSSSCSSRQQYPELRYHPY